MTTLCKCGPPGKENDSPLTGRELNAYPCWMPIKRSKSLKMLYKTDVQVFGVYIDASTFQSNQAKSKITFYDYIIVF